LLKITLKGLLWFWLLSNAEVTVHVCSATKMCSGLFCLTIFILVGHSP